MGANAHVASNWISHKKLDNFSDLVSLGSVYHYYRDNGRVEDASSEMKTLFNDTMNMVGFEK